MKLFLAGFCADILSLQSNYWFASHDLRILPHSTTRDAAAILGFDSRGIFALTPRTSTNTLTLSYSGISCSPCSYQARGLGVVAGAELRLSTKTFPIFARSPRMCRATSRSAIAHSPHQNRLSRISFDVSAVLRLSKATAEHLLHIATSNQIASNILCAINFKNQRVSTRNSTAPTHAPPDFGCAADNGAAGGAQGA